MLKRKSNFDINITSKYQKTQEYNIPILKRCEASLLLYNNDKLTLLKSCGTKRKMESRFSNRVGPRPTKYICPIHDDDKSICNIYDCDGEKDYC